MIILSYMIMKIQSNKNLRFNFKLKKIIVNDDNFQQLLSKNVRDCTITHENNGLFTLNCNYKVNLIFEYLSEDQMKFLIKYLNI